MTKEEWKGMMGSMLASVESAEVGHRCEITAVVPKTDDFISVGSCQNHRVSFIRGRSG